MTEHELFVHYEKIYFHELGRKEQIFSRLNIPLAVMVAIVGFCAVILGGDYKQLPFGMMIWFWVVFGCSAMALVVGTAFFVDSLLGRMDQALPTANDTEAWRIEMLNYYSDQPNPEEIVAAELRQMLYRAFMNCATISTLNNDRKSSSLYFCNIALITAAAFAVAAYALETIPNL
jgi:Na+/melibiose symporter-like transporter